MIDWNLVIVLLIVAIIEGKNIYIFKHKNDRRSLED